MIGNTVDYMRKSEGINTVCKNNTCMQVPDSSYKNTDSSEMW